MGERNKNMTYKGVLLFVLLSLSMGVWTLAKGGRAGSTQVVYVTSQGLYFDTFVAVDPLPMDGPFQLLAEGTTEFGPGDAGYLVTFVHGNNIVQASISPALCATSGNSKF